MDLTVGRVNHQPLIIRVNNENFKYLFSNPLVSPAAKPLIDGAKATSNSQIVGVQSICVELGKFYGPLHTEIFVYLAFDEDDKLIEVSIRRDIDAP